MAKRAEPVAVGILIGVLAAACTGTVDNDGNGANPSSGSGESAGTGNGNGNGAGASGGTGGPGAGGSSGGAVDPGQHMAGGSRLRRLTSFEYKNSVIDLLGAGTEVKTEFDADPVLNNLTALGASSLALSATTTEQFDSSAFALAESLVKDTARRAKVVSCMPTGAADEACLRKFITEFGLKVFRRPLAAEEVDAYAAVGKAAMTQTTDFWTGIQYTLATLLDSPNFIYRTEFGAPDKANGARNALNGYELASRLSFMLWGSTPDDALLEAAASGALATSEGLAQQAARLLGSTRSQSAILRVFSEMLSLDALDSLTQDPALFPAAASATLGASMRAETENVLRDLLFTRNADYREFFTGTTTSINGELAKLYGVSGPTGTGFQNVTLAADGPRAGYLGQASFLAVRSHNNGTSPTLRGKFIQETLLCNSIPSAPADVDTTIPDTDLSKTKREQLKTHQEVVSCATCHVLMDSTGLALEHFDAIGAYRETDRGMPLDVTGSFAGVSFNGARELGKVIAENPKTAEGNPEVADCLVRNLFRVATGHLEESGEQAAVAQLSTAFTADGFKVRNVITKLVDSDGFRFVGQPE